MLPDRPLQLIVEDCNGLVSCTFSTPDIAEIPIQPLSNDTRSLTYPGCAPGQTCLYAPVDFFLERTGQDLGAASLTAATPSKPTPFFVVRDNPVQSTDPTVTLWGSNLHTWIEVYLYEGNCTSFPACQRYSARVMERAPDGSFIKIQMPALDNVDVFKSTWFWAIHDALPRPQYNEWVRLPRFVMNFAAVHGFRFENEADKATLGDFDGVYGNNAYICIGAFGFCPIRVRDPVYLLFYATAYKPWVSAGTCEGMAALSALLEQKQVDPGSWEAGVRYAAGFSGAGPDGSLPPKPATYRNPTFDPRSPTNLWGLLRTHHGVQTSAEFIQEFFRDSGGGFLSFSIAGNPNARLAELRNNPSGQIICMTPKPGKGHCVTPYAVEDVDDTHSRIWIYDNNYPAQDYGDDRPTEFNAYIEIDRAANRYVYKPRPTEFLGTGLHTYPISLWQNERHMPGISEIKDLVYMLVFGDTKSLYTTPDGDAFGWRPDGSFVDNFPGAVALTPFAGVITETFSVPMAFTNTVPAPSVEILSHGGDVGFFAAYNGHVMQIKTPATETGDTADVAVLYDKSQLSGFRYTSEQAVPKTEPSIGMVLGERERAVFRWGGLSVTANGSLGFHALDGLRGVAFENGTVKATQHTLTVETVDGYQGVSGAHIFGPFTIPPGAHHRTFIEDWPTSSRLRSEIDLDGNGVPDKTETVIGVPCQMTDIDNDEAPDICVLNPIYMPQIGAHGNANPVNNQPDLEGSLKVIPNKKSFTAGEPVVIQATVTNRGMDKTGPFWVDLFINPAQPPTAANMIWNKNCGMNPCFGIAWYVSKGLQSGDSIVLDSTSASFGERFTSWPGWFANGTKDLYLYVDSYGLSSPDGAVKESNETNNEFEVHELTVTGVNPAQSLAIPALQRE